MLPRTCRSRIGLAFMVLGPKLDTSSQRLIGFWNK